MAWSVPLTAVSNATLTAAQWNASVRDNLLETAPAKATTAGSLFVATGANAIAERIPAGATVGTLEATATTTYTDLTTVGPAVTVTSGSKCLVIISAQVTNSTSTSGSFMSFAGSGATTFSGSDASALVFYAPTTGQPVQASRVVLQTTLNSGANTFTAKYKAAAGSAQFSQRNIFVIPF